MRRSLILVGLALLPAPALADAAAILSDAAVLCAAQGGGTFGSEGAVVQLDVTGDGQADTIVDEGRFTCTSAASLYGGSGGSTLHVFVGEVQSDFLVQGYEVLNWAGNTILLQALHGSECNGVGADPCFEALVWNGERFMTVRAPQQ
jgi:hypothetical protein